MAIVPSIVAALVAYPMWRRGEPIIGNLAGTVLVFGAAFMLIMREAADLDRLERVCLDNGFVCPAHPSPFTRYAIFAFIALVEVVALFSWSLRVERQLRERHYAPEWRSR
jgi:hypothetical protein